MGIRCDAVVVCLDIPVATVIIVFVWQPLVSLKQLLWCKDVQDLTMNKEIECVLLCSYISFMLLDFIETL